MIDTNVNMIRKTIKEIQKEIEKNDMKQLKNTNKFEYIYQLFQKFPEFSEKHPTLLRKVANREDLTHLETMLTNIEAIQQQKKTRMEAETEMGNEMASKYFTKIDKQNDI